MRNSAILRIFVLMFALTAGPVSAEDVIDASKNPEYLFTLASKSGTFEDDTLTLKGIPLVVYFSDHPVRKSGHINLQKFLKLWDQGVDNFEKNPPNAELAIYEKSGDKHAIVIITKPTVEEDSISFEVIIIDERIPESFEHSTLFIDNFRTVGGRIW